VPAVAVTVSNCFSPPVFILSRSLVGAQTVSGTIGEIITGAKWKPIPCIARSAGTASRNGVPAIRNISGSTGKPTLSLWIVTGRPSAGETGGVACRIL
jgi:hypothetical protein